MKSLTTLLASLLIVGITSGVHARSSLSRGAVPADQTQKLDEQMQKSQPAEEQSTEDKAKTQ